MTTFIFGIVVTISDDMATTSASCSCAAATNAADLHVDAEVDDGEPGPVEHERDQALADVVDVALDGADHDCPAPAGGFADEVRRDDVHRRLHRVGRHEDLGDEELAGRHLGAGFVHRADQRRRS